MRIETHHNSNRVYCSVIDTGTGIDQSMISKVFDPFFTTKAEGIGLGLSSAKGIINAHNGEITVESKLGEYTKFEFYLPKS